MHPSVDKILASNKIRHTSIREEVLGEFLGKDYAMSQPDLEKALGNQHDRVTIYRTLSLFLDKGILHKVLDDAGAMKFALCPETCSEHDHDHEHVHFKCTICGQTECFERMEVPHFTMPPGYAMQEANLLIRGTCPRCGGKG
ncbi:MAG: transcriptional repressor [Bacteroidia bacterium]|nr:transcriptional repressor [Bacteroidia bacterium]